MVVTMVVVGVFFMIVIIVHVFVFSVVVVVMLIMSVFVVVRVLVFRVVFMIMIVVVMRMIVIMIMFVLGMLFMIVIVVIVVIIVLAMVMAVRLEQGPLAEIEQPRALRFQKRGDRGACGQRSNRIFHPRRQVLTDPEHQIRVLQGRSLRGPEAVFVGRSAGLNDQIRSADTVHDPRNQRMDWRNVHGHARNVGHRCAAQQSSGN